MNNYYVFCILVLESSNLRMHCFPLSSTNISHLFSIRCQMGASGLDSDHISSFTVWNHSLLTVQLSRKVVSILISVMKNDTDIGSMQKEVMSVTEQVERKKNDTEKDDTERKRKLDTSHLEGLLFNKIVNHFEANREINSTSGSKSKHFSIASRTYVFLIGRLRKKIFKSNKTMFNYL